MDTLEQKENDIVTKKKMTLRAVYGKQQGSLFIQPVTDSRTGRLVGVKNLSEEEKRNATRVVEASTTRKIQDGVVVDLSNEIDSIDWNWIKHSPAIAMSFADAQSSPNALFYVEDLDAETEKKISKKDLVYKAMTHVKESSAHKKLQASRLLGQDATHFSPLQIDDFLTSIAFENPEKIIKVYEDKNSKTRLFYYQLLDSKLITKERGGIIKYEEITLGINEEQALEWLKTPENRDIVQQLTQTLNPMGGSDEEDEKLLKAKKQKENNK